MLQALERPWILHGRLREHRSGTRALPSVPGDVDPRVRIAALATLAAFARHLGEASAPEMVEALHIARDLHDRALEARILRGPPLPRRRRS